MKIYELFFVWFELADAAQKVESFVSPATSFIQRWLPLFYVPSLVVVPLAVKGIPAAEGAKIGAILGVCPQNSSPEGLKHMDMSSKLKIC